MLHCCTCCRPCLPLHVQKGPPATPDAQTPRHGDALHIDVSPRPCHTAPPHSPAGLTPRGALHEASTPLASRPGSASDSSSVAAAVAQSHEPSRLDLFSSGAASASGAAGYASADVLMQSAAGSRMSSPRGCYGTSGAPSQPGHGYLQGSGSGTAVAVQIYTDAVLQAQGRGRRRSSTSSTISELLSSAAKALKRAAPKVHPAGAPDGAGGADGAASVDPSEASAASSMASMVLAAPPVRGTAVAGSRGSSRGEDRHSPGQGTTVGGGGGAESMGAGRQQGLDRSGAEGACGWEARPWQASPGPQPAVVPCTPAPSPCQAPSGSAGKALGSAAAEAAAPAADSPGTGRLGSPAGPQGTAGGPLWPPATPMHAPPATSSPGASPRSPRMSVSVSTNLGSRPASPLRRSSLAVYAPGMHTASASPPMATTAPRQAGTASPLLQQLSPLAPAGSQPSSPAGTSHRRMSAAAAYPSPQCGQLSTSQHGHVPSHQASIGARARRFSEVYDPPAQDLINGSGPTLQPSPPSTLGQHAASSGAAPALSVSPLGLPAGCTSWRGEACDGAGHTRSSALGVAPSLQDWSSSAPASPAAASFRKAAAAPLPPAYGGGAGSGVDEMGGVYAAVRLAGRERRASACSAGSGGGSMRSSLDLQPLPPAGAALAAYAGPRFELPPRPADLPALPADPTQSLPAGFGPS